MDSGFMIDSLPRNVMALIAVGLVVVAVAAVASMVSFRRVRMSAGQVATSLLNLVWIAPLVGIVVYLGSSAVPTLHPRPHDHHQPLDEAIEEEALDVGDLPISVIRPASLTDKDKEILGDVPEWTRNAPQVHGETATFVVSSKPNLDPHDAEQQVLNSVSSMFREYFDRMHGFEGEWSVPADLLQQYVIRNRHVATFRHDFGSVTANMHRVYAQVQLTPSTTDPFVSSWRSQVVSRRIKVLGTLGGLIVIILATLSAYFRLDGSTQGAYRRRLKVASVSFVAASCLAVSLFLPMLQSADVSKPAVGMTESRSVSLPEPHDQEQH